MSEPITTGIIRTYYDTKNTKLKEEYFICNYEKEGKYKKYHKNGNLWEEIDYIKGMIHGAYKKYYENGILKEEFLYRT
jgi:antitoxin component YwqK of YwqJK toxin-antitoxin module